MMNIKEITVEYTCQTHLTYISTQPLTNQFQGLLKRSLQNCLSGKTTRYEVL